MKYFISILSLVLVSCGGGSKQENAESNQEPSVKAVSNRTSCLAGMPDPATWLPMAKAADLLKLPETELKQKVYQDLSCQYNWKNDRTYKLKVGANEIEVPAANSISITIENLDDKIEKWLSNSYVKQTEMSYLEYFDQFHGAPMTKEDKAEVNKRLDEKAEKDENFTKQQADVGKSVLAMAKTENFTELTDLGDKANYYVQLAPNLRELRLAILSDNVTLMVTADVSDDDAEDLSVARAVAEAVLARCD